MTGNWTDATKWSGGKVPTSSDDVTIAHTTGYDLVVTIPTGITAAANSLLITGGTGTHLTTLTLVGSAKLNVSGAITLSNPLSQITGAGTISATGGITGSGVIEAVGGTLTVNGTIASGPVLAIDTASTSELLINGAATSAAAISLTTNTQTLGIGSTGALTISAAQSVTNATIAMGGGSLTDTKGLTLGTGSSLVGFGSVTAAVTGVGVLEASGGTLTITGAIDASGTASTLEIASGSVLNLAGTIGTASIQPVVKFLSSTGTLQDTATAMANVHLGQITGFTGADLIKLKDSGTGTGDIYSISGQTLTIKTSSGTVLQSFTFANGTAMGSVKVVDASGVDTISWCFMAGTMIRTPDGEVPVETLTRGDLVMTTDGVAKPVSWLGKQTKCSVFSDPIRSWPIRVKAGALEENVPSRDLLLSPDHALLVDGVLIHAGALVNGTSIVREASVPRVWVYYHVELDDHSLILAENTPAETFVDNVDRLNFDNWAEHEALYPEGKPIVELPYPRAKARRQVPVDIRVALAARAEAMGAVEAQSRSPDPVRRA